MITTEQIFKMLDDIKNRKHKSYIITDVNTELQQETWLEIAWMKSVNLCLLSGGQVIPWRD